MFHYETVQLSHLCSNAYRSLVILHRIILLFEKQFSVGSRTVQCNICCSVAIMIISNNYIVY